MAMHVRELETKSALSESGLPGLDYSLNPYVHCEHQCVYCYVPTMPWINEKDWSSWIGVRKNIADVLDVELSKKKRGVVGISTVTDAYQPIERDYNLTRRCLEVLLDHQWPISIQTKSTLVLRDKDLIARFKQAEVGFTITSLDEKAQKVFEPGASSPKERLAALQELSKAGIKTWAFIGPILPGVTDDDLERLVDELARVHVSWIMIDQLRLKGNIYNKVHAVYAAHFPEIIHKLENADRLYYNIIQKRLARLCLEKGIECKNAF